MPDEMTEDRREELLRRVLQFDVEDAIARYEAEAGCCVVEVTLRLNDNDKYAMELKTAKGTAAKGKAQRGSLSAEELAGMKETLRERKAQAAGADGESEVLALREQHVQRGVADREDREVDRGQRAFEGRRGGGLFRHG